MTVPMVIVLALVIGGISGDSQLSPGSTPDPRAELTFDAPPRVQTDAAPCAKVLTELPLALGTLDQRRVVTRPNTPYVVAWGSPAVVLRCGVDRPKDLNSTSSAEFIQGGVQGGPFYDVQRAGDGNVFTTVDRAAYVSITIPGKYQGGDILPTVSAAIAKALPAVCSTDYTAPREQRCAYRA